MSDETYNGWTNRETWAVSLWLSNDEGLHDATTERLEEAFKTSYADAAVAYESMSAEELERMAIGGAADMCREWIDELFDPSEQLLSAETRHSFMLNVGSTWRVNWHEVAESWLAGQRGELVRSAKGR